ncbi:FCD domain-containing protein [Labrys monachus]|uniref:DNA-binding GntR family transcriptional regulator/transposase n=1 Tax=Labrys monachus TaxID=217067 RepID=A0ABU0FQ31_9HYPH|nr:FCD domain-containing protein [Labrys monachus]MDQ0396467.1 DNA-binding GntR family transcriptional regulator/transposase [Labrys monachus]
MTRTDRLAWIEAYENIGSVGAVCARFGISQPTFRKWLRRYREQGPAGLDEPSRRPASSPNRKVFEREETLILDLRRRHGHGIHRIRRELESQGIALSTDTILKVLRRAGEPPLRPSRAPAGLTPPAPAPRAEPPPAPRGVPNDQLAEAIARLITDGRFRPGQKLSEAALGDLLGAGRAAVRTALHKLEPGGLVVLQRNRGAFVNNPSMSEVEQAYAARRLIEGEVVADVCRHCTAHDVRLLRRHVEQQAEAEKAGDRGSLIRLLTEFHSLVASLGESRVLEDFVRTLSVKTSLAVLLYDHVGSSCAIEEHARLIDLIAAGDEAGARRLIEQHLTTNQGRLPKPDPAGIETAGGRPA